jgi:hypothetical protein
VTEPRLGGAAQQAGSGQALERDRRVEGERQARVVEHRAQGGERQRPGDRDRLRHRDQRRWELAEGPGHRPGHDVAVGRQVETVGGQGRDPVGVAGQATGGAQPRDQLAEHQRTAAGALDEPAQDLLGHRQHPRA